MASGSQDINIFESIDNFLADDSYGATLPGTPSGTDSSISRNHSLASDFDDSPVVRRKKDHITEKPQSIEVDDVPEIVNAVTRKSPRSRKLPKETDVAVAAIFSNTRSKTRTTSARNRKEIETIEIPDDELFPATSHSLPESNFDEDNAEVMVKVYWESKLQKHPLRQHQTFSFLCEALAEQNNCDVESIVLTMNEKIVDQKATPDSIGYTIGKFIFARSMKNAFVNQTVSKTAIELKIQSAVWKKPIFIHIEPKQKMKILVILCAEKLKCSPNTLQFKFDGDVLDLDATPEELELEGGEVLDLRIVEA